MTETARLRLPELAAAQAQKHVTHNEALGALDTLVQISVADKDLTTPPGSPDEGDCYIVATGGTGAWTGWDGRIARYRDGAWTSFLPGAGGGDGWLAYVGDENAFYVFTGSAWEPAAAHLGLGSIATQDADSVAITGGAISGISDLAVADGGTGASDAAAARTNLGLGTAATANTGTSGAAVPLLNTTCSVGAAWYFNAGSSVPVNFVWNDSGGGVGPFLHLDRASGSPAAFDLIGGVRFAGRDDGAAYTVYGEINGQIVDPTNGAEEGRFGFRTPVGGTFNFRAYVGAGIYTPGATDGDKGADTINAGAVYDDGALLTCMALQDEFLETGTIDPEANWDPLVPDIEIPEQIEDVPVLEDAEVEVDAFEELDDRVVCHKTVECRKVPKVTAKPVVDAKGDPVVDEAGNPVLRQVPVMGRKATPARTIPRRHEVAHLFRRMLDDGFDPRDPAQYVARLRADKALPGMPTRAEWTHNGLSIGELLSRKWLALEMLALVVCNHEDRIAALEQIAGD